MKQKCSNIQPNSATSFYNKKPTLRIALTILMLSVMFQDIRCGILLTKLLGYEAAFVSVFTGTTKVGVGDSLNLQVYDIILSGTPVANNIFSETGSNKVLNTNPNSSGSAILCPNGLSITVYSFNSGFTSKSTETSLSASGFNMGETKNIAGTSYWLVGSSSGSMKIAKYDLNNLTAAPAISSLLSGLPIWISTQDVTNLIGSTIGVGGKLIVTDSTNLTEIINISTSGAFSILGINNLGVHCFIDAVSSGGVLRKFNDIDLVLMYS